MDCRLQQTVLDLDVSLEVHATVEVVEFSLNLPLDCRFFVCLFCYEFLTAVPAG